MAEADPKLKDKPKKKGMLGVLVPVLAFVAGAGAGGAGAGIALVQFGIAGVGIGGGHAPAPHGAAAAVPEGPLEYVPIESAFTSNLADSGRYLQVKISLSTYGGADAVAAVAKHQPALVSAVLAALGEVREPDIESAKAKDALRERLKAVINTTLKSRGEPGGVEEVFFTSLVVQ